MSIPHAFTFICCITVFRLLLALPASAAALNSDYVDEGGYIVSKNNAIIDEHRANELFIPASTIKLLTAMAALKELGPDYRFTTEIYLDDRGVLYIKGSGDPLLTSETLADLARKLKEIGVRKIAAYVLDDSLFNLEHPLPDGSINSTNPYDAPNSGLAVNFNSISVHKLNDGTILSGEHQTPLLPLASEIGKQLAPGRHRVNINAYRIQGNNPSLRYTFELLHAFCLEQGITATPLFRQDKVPDSARLLLSHSSSRRLEQIVQLCLEYSSNFMANQLALATGLNHFGPPATWEKARHALQLYGLKAGVAPAALTIREGSGLSRNNRISPAGMLKILEAFREYRQLLPYRHGMLIKSGTLDRVYCYAGYGGNQTSAAAFVLMLNQTTNTRDILVNQLSKLLAHHR